MNFDDPKFRKPTNATGDWHVSRTALFDSEALPSDTKFAVEKMTGQLLARAPLELAAPALRYSGTSTAGGHPCTVRLDLKDAARDRFLYAFTSEGSAPRKWEDEAEFTAACERRFAHWCGKLSIVPNANAWKANDRVAIRDIVLATHASEEAAARRVEDSAPVESVQQQVLAGLKAGQGFFTAHKEGGTHLLFDGKAYRRNDYGDEPNIDETYATDAEMLACLRRFYDWDAQRDVYPHKKAEVEVWRYILGQLRKR